MWFKLSRLIYLPQQQGVGLGWQDASWDSQNY